ncbi:FtsB family cell division protein [Halalkalibacter hemicellulosilyticus]|uniref:Cell division protein DivIC n=1 Tax=Halalkalibacter hemicellulosilyticusJCM 9152 TaxID=1236971 RepID=W4QIK8_9BACI|nr:septum formation initiator family protein [Halalkalibacter hemicellulosilyticus]GAE31757.1 cell division protein DivIC [Halalkalibacter hemicellulosilyticusJCM 9152]
MVTNRMSRVRELDNQYIQQKERELELATKKRRGLIRRLTVIGIATVVLLGFGGVTISSQLAVVDEKRQEKAELEVFLAELKQEEDRLHVDVENYQDVYYIAEIARRDYFLTMPGETLFKIPNIPID